MNLVRMSVSVRAFLFIAIPILMGSHVKQYTVHSNVIAMVRNSLKYWFAI